MLYLTSIAIEGSEEALAVCTQEQRRVKHSVCKLLLAHQLVSWGLLVPGDAAKLVAHKGATVKKKIK